MAEANDSPGGISSAAPQPSDRRRFSVHAALGGGAAAEVLLWRRRHAGIATIAGSTAAWLLFEFAGYSLPSLVANALLLLVAILFFWARAATLLNRPLPPLPNIEVSDKVVEKAADEARVWINRVLAIARDIAIARDRKVFLKVILVLWLVSYVGSLFSFLTLVYVGLILAFTGPALYDKYQDHVDEKLGVAHGMVLKHYEGIAGRAGMNMNKVKKSQ